MERIKNTWLLMKSSFSVLMLGILQWILQSVFMGAVYMYVRDHKILHSFSVSQLNHSLH